MMKHMPQIIFSAIALAFSQLTESQQQTFYTCTVEARIFDDAEYQLFIHAKDAGGREGRRERERDRGRDGGRSSKRGHESGRDG